MIEVGSEGIIDIKSPDKNDKDDIELKNEIHSGNHDEGLLEGAAFGEDYEIDNTSSETEDDEGVIIISSKMAGNNHNENKKTPKASLSYVRPQFIKDSNDETNKSQEKLLSSSEELRKLRFSRHLTAFDVDIDSLEEHPWRNKTIDISDYFNYGFNEKTWKIYSERQLRLRAEKGYGPHQYILANRENKQLQQAKKHSNNVSSGEETHKQSTSPDSMSQASEYIPNLNSSNFQNSSPIKSGSQFPPIPPPPPFAPPVPQQIGMPTRPQIPFPIAPPMPPPMAPQFQPPSFMSVPFVLQEQREKMVSHEFPFSPHKDSERDNHEEQNKLKNKYSPNDYQRGTRKQTEIKRENYDDRKRRRSEESNHRNDSRRTERSHREPRRDRSSGRNERRRRRSHSRSSSREKNKRSRK